jgi:hypothetical protein
MLKKRISMTRAESIGIKPISKLLVIPLIAGVLISLIHVSLFYGFPLPRITHIKIISPSYFIFKPDPIKNFLALDHLSILDAVHLNDFEISYSIQHPHYLNSLEATERFKNRLNCLLLAQNLISSEAEKLINDCTYFKKLKEDSLKESSRHIPIDSELIEVTAHYSTFKDFLFSLFVVNPLYFTAIIFSVTLTIYSLRRYDQRT